MIIKANQVIYYYVTMMSSESYSMRIYFTKKFVVASTAFAAALLRNKFLPALVFPRKFYYFILISYNEINVALQLPAGRSH